MSGHDSARRLLIFGRFPEAGHAKTRLSPALGEQEAAELYGAFLDDAVKGATGAGRVELWVPGRPGAVPFLQRRYPGIRVRLQPKGSLGERLEAAFATAFREGADYTVAVGSDHPTLPPDLLERAFRELCDAPLVLGPSRDGGYYAIGLRRHVWPRSSGLFRGAPWSDPELLGWTRARASELDLRHVELPAWYDVDRPEDLKRMEADLVPGTATAAAWARLRPVGAGEGG